MLLFKTPDLEDSADWRRCYQTETGFYIHISTLRVLFDVPKASEAIHFEVHDKPSSWRIPVIASEEIIRGCSEITISVAPEYLNDLRDSLGELCDDLLWIETIPGDGRLFRDAKKHLGKKWYVECWYC